MPLSCSCDYEAEPGDITSWGASDYLPLDTTRRKRCGSCGDLINVGKTVIKFDLFKIPDTDIEVRIYGEEGEVPRAPVFHCERCADLYFSLEELGFCVWWKDDMTELVKEYAELYGPNATANSPS